jgi:thiosulfate/3-mercaptopyruvate sulfurtransferase
LQDPGVAVVDATFHLPELERDARAEFIACHVPGAVYFDIDQVADPGHELGHMLPDAKTFADQIGALGLGNDRRVIAYDSRGLYSAARVWWMFRLYGYDDVAVLDGGLPKWLNERRPVESGWREPATARFAPGKTRDLFRSWQAVRDNLSSRRAQLVDARTPGRFHGSEPDPYPGVRGGHIPESFNLYWSNLLDARTRTLLAPDRLRQKFIDAGVALDRPVIASCGSGVTACILALAMHSLGKDDWAVYDGSWDEWGRRADLPITSG